MEENLIAPCGMNCGLCVSYLSREYDLNQQWFQKAYCAGCLPRGKNCIYMKKHCALLGSGRVRFCFECADFPCGRLKALDERYRARYHMSMIENLETIQTQGMANFLTRQEEEWRCPECGGQICCHNGLCLRCQADTLRRNKKYRWGER